MRNASCWTLRVGGLLADLRPDNAERQRHGSGSQLGQQHGRSAPDCWQSCSPGSGFLAASTLRAVKLRGARITGTPRPRRQRTLTCALRLRDCYIDEPVNLDEATAPAIRLHGCHLPGLTAEQLHTAGDLDLAGVTSTGDVVVTLTGARIGGTLDLSGAKLANAGGQR